MRMLLAILMALATTVQAGTRDGTEGGGRPNASWTTSRIRSGSDSFGMEE